MIDGNKPFVIKGRIQKYGGGGKDNLPSEKLEYIGGSNAESRKKALDSYPEFVKMVNDVANYVGISPEVLLARVYKEGLLDTLIYANNTYSNHSKEQILNEDLPRILNNKEFNGLTFQRVMGLVNQNDYDRNKEIFDFLKVVNPTENYEIDYSAIDSLQAALEASAAYIYANKIKLQNKYKDREITPAIQSFAYNKGPYKLFADKDLQDYQNVIDTVTPYVLSSQGQSSQESDFLKWFRNYFSPQNYINLENIHLYK